jgi:hypothetical protein
MVHRLSLFLLTAILLGNHVSSAAQSRVEIEVLTRPSLNAATASQKWMKSLADLGFGNVQFRPAQAGDRIDVQGADGGIVRVTAQLDEHGILVTPGGQFAISDSAKLKKWLADLQTGGVEGIGQSRTAFGFTRNQLDQARQSLAAPVGFATKGMSAAKALEQICAGLKAKVTVEPAIERAIAADEPVRDELEDVASGTALAAIVRPAGGVLIPHYADGNLELQLTATKEVGDSWPIGWPPGEKDEGKIIPALFEFIKVEIVDTPAKEAIDAIQVRLKTPFLYDYNNMARNRIDLAKKVKMPAGKTFYKKILDHVLFQAGLKCEIRLDDAGKPIVWVTTQKP